MAAKLTRRSVTAGLVALGATGAARAKQISVGPWEAGAPAPIRTQEIYPGLLDGRIYLAGGLSPDAGPDGSIGVSDRVFRWADGAWSEIAALPEARHHPNLVGHDGAVHAIGGFRFGEGGAWNMIANTTRYSPEDDAWVEFAPMPAPYGETVAASLNGVIHVATGRQPNGEANANWTDHGDRAAHYVYDAGEDRWREAAPAPTARNSAAGAALNGRLHVVGGRLVGDGNRAEHEAYDPQSDRWETLAPLPQAQGGLAAAVSGGRLFAFGGEYFDADGGGVYPECWIYDPDTDAWSEGPAMRTPRHGLGGLAIGEMIFAIGGATAAGGNGTSDLVETLIPAG